MMNSGYDNLKTTEGEATLPSRRSDLRSRLLHGALWTLLAAVVLGPAVASFLYAVALPASRITRQGDVAPASSAAQEGQGRTDTKVLPVSEPLRRLRSDESFWKARIDFAKKDAISLALDLVDSTATLDIRGVPVRVCRIEKIEKSSAFRFFKNKDGFRYRLSKPMIVRREAATLPKEPIRVEIAPKDTTEAAKAATRPLAPEEVDVYFTLYFDHDLAIAVRQIEKPSTRSGSREKRRMNWGDRFDQAERAIAALFRSEVPQHELRIEVTLTRDDAKAIYRALGREARVALRL